jgi:hypothetical protein
MTTIEQALDFARKELDRGIRNEQERFRNEQTMLGKDPNRVKEILKQHLAECEAYREKALVEIERKIRGALHTLH